MTLLDREPADLLSDLTSKQVEVLELLLQHKTTKQMARELGLAPNTVDARIATVRDKWGTTDRKATARVYAHLLETCEKSPCGFSPLASDILQGQGFDRDLPRSPVFSVADVQTIEHLAGMTGKRAGLEALDAKFGKVGRLAAIVVLSALLAITLVASLAIATALGRFI